MIDDGRISQGGSSFSAMCSPPISMMYKGRTKRSSSKLNLKLVENGSGDALVGDEDMWAGLLKISKSSEELWKDVYAVFSPPTPIGAKADAYPATAPFAQLAAGSAAPPPTSTTTSSASTAASSTNRTTATTPSAPTPIDVGAPTDIGGKTTNCNTIIPSGTYVQTVPEKVIPQGATVTNSIAIAQVPTQPPNIKVQPTVTESSVESKPKRSPRDQSYLPVAGKHPPSKPVTTPNNFNASNIHSIINENAYTGDSREDGSSPHGSRVPVQHHHPSHSLSQRHNDLHEPNHHHLNGLSMPQMHSATLPSTNHSHSHSHPQHDLDVHRGHSVYDSRPTHHPQSLYMHSPAPMYNMDNSLLPCTEGHDPRNCNCNPMHSPSGHSGYNHSSSMSGYNNTSTSNSNSGNSANSNEKWTEVVTCCSKLLAIASSSLTNTVTFSQLVDALNLARQITTATASAILNSSSYPSFQSTSVSDELNRLVMETLGTLGQNPQSPNVQVSPHADTHLSHNRNFPYFSNPPSLSNPSSAYSNSAPPSAFSSPTSYPTPPFASGSVSMPSPNSINGTWPTEPGTFSNFVDLRRKLPVPSPHSDSEESPDQPSSPKSPPALSVVPLSPSCLSPGGSSSAVPPIASDRKEKDKDEKGTWKKPNRKSKRKFEADLECKSCGVRQTPEWRRGPFGAKTLCNACGLHWAKVLKAEGKGDAKRVAMLEAKRSQFMMTQKRGAGTTAGYPGNTTPGS